MKEKTVQFMDSAVESKWVEMCQMGNQHPTLCLKLTLICRWDPINIYIWGLKILPQIYRLVMVSYKIIGEKYTYSLKPMLLAIRQSL